MCGTKNGHPNELEVELFCFSTADVADPHANHSLRPRRNPVWRLGGQQFIAICDKIAIIFGMNLKTAWLGVCFALLASLAGCRSVNHDDREMFYSGWMHPNGGSSPAQVMAPLK